MHQWRTISSGGHHIHCRVAYVIMHIDQIQRVLTEIARLTDDESHRLAGEAYLVRG